MSQLCENEFKKTEAFGLEIQNTAKYLISRKYERIRTYYFDLFCKYENNLGVFSV